MAELILEIVEGAQAGREIALSGAVEAGRDPSASLALDDDQVSRRHARIAPSSGGAVVEDLGSTNGTYVNDQPIHGPREFEPGDRVRFGLTVMELRSPKQVTARRSAAGPVPQITEIGQGVLQPVPEEQARSAESPVSSAPSFLVEETEPAFVPHAVVGDAEAESNFQALAALVDPRVKHKTNIAVFAVLSIAGLAVLIFFGVR